MSHQEANKGQMKTGQKNEPFEIVNKPNFETTSMNECVRSELDAKFRNLSYSTRLIHVGQEPALFDYHAVVPPVILSTSFERCGGNGASRVLGKPTTSEHVENQENEPGFMQKVAEAITGKDTGEMTTSTDRGIMGRIADTLIGGTTSPEKKSLAKKDESVTDTACTGTSETKGKSQIVGSSLQKPVEGRETTTAQAKGTRGGAQGIGKDTSIQQTTKESGVRTSTYESSFPARGISHLPQTLGIESHFGRMENPTRVALESSLATLEDAKYALAFPSGTSTLATCGFLLESGNHVLVLDEVYADTARFFKNCATRMGVEVTFVDMTDLTSMDAAVKSTTSMVWIETPTNPSLKLVDIKGVVDIVRRKNQNTIVIVDSTVASPLFQSPLKCGADIVIHSLTKHINGHYDVVMGALMTNRQDLIEKLRLLQDTLGCVPAPFDCYLVNRSIKTYPLRMKEQMNSAIKLATNLQNHPSVHRLMYPGLSTHPHNSVFKKQMSGFGGIITFKLNGNQQDVDSFMSSLKLFSCAANMGGYVSLIDQPAMHETKRDDVTRDLDPTLIRLSIGLEDADDLLNDLLTALEKIRHTSAKTDQTGGGIGTVTGLPEKRKIMMEKQ